MHAYSLYLEKLYQNMQQITKNTNYQIHSKPPQLVNNEQRQIPFQPFLPFITPQILPYLHQSYGINPLNYPFIPPLSSKNVAQKYTFDELKIPDIQNPSSFESKDSSQIQQYSQFNDLQSISEQQQELDFQKRGTKRDNPPKKISSKQKNDSQSRYQSSNFNSKKTPDSQIKIDAEEQAYLLVDVELLDKSSKFKRFNKMRQLAALCFIQNGHQKEAFQSYLKKTCPQMNEKNIKLQSSTYQNKVNKLLYKIPQKAVDFLELSFNLKIQSFAHKQILRLAKYLKFYKAHFGLQQQNLIIQLLKSFVLVQKAPTSKQCLESLYRTFRRLLRNSQKIEDPQIEFLKVKNNTITDFLKLREKQIKAKILKKQEACQEKGRRKCKKQLVKCFRRIQNIEELKVCYRCINPEAHLNSLFIETNYLLKQVFLQAVYKLQRMTTNLKKIDISKFLLYTKSCIFLEKMLTPIYRSLAMILIDIYEEIGELKNQKIFFYANKLKQTIKNIRQSSLYTIDSKKEQHLDQKKVFTSNLAIKHDRVEK